MSSKEPAKYPVKSLAKALRLLEFLGRPQEGTSIAVLSKELKIGKSTVHRLLATLREFDLVWLDPNASISYGIYFTKPEDGTWGCAGADYGIAGRGVLDATDYQTGKIRWTHSLGFNDTSDTGVLTTGSGLTFTGDATGNMLALDTATGKTLWHAGLGADIQTSPTTYELNGRQYVLVGAGQALFAWALPQG